MRALFLTMLIVLSLAGLSYTQRCINGHYNRCGSACPITCQNQSRPPFACTYQCIPGCTCNAGYVRRDRVSHHCVRPRSCPRFG
ncbi:unnamed protein product [Medioppia subpectinata]|uniref:TIL domain-containing protein n=1 Tax=Medioppia subpectinata TaxID=1979941 RepID=A0A7R9KKV0_9ACAR|nr:unnamed protein product [Medioppia subpectinata]CAG2104216.1 unnamed protein product [Medioppia subpectinata]